MEHLYSVRIAHRKATEHHLPYGVTQCHLPPDAGKSAPSEPQPDRLVLDLPTQEGQRAELTLAVLVNGYILRWFTCP